MGVVLLSMNDLGVGDCGFESFSQLWNMELWRFFGFLFFLYTYYY